VEAQGEDDQGRGELLQALENLPWPFPRV